MGRSAETQNRSSFVLYVSPAGHDGWSGTLDAPSADGRDGPLATIGRARDMLRAMKKKGALTRPVKVLIRGGPIV